MSDEISNPPPDKPAKTRLAICIVLFVIVLVGIAAFIVAGTGQHSAAIGGPFQLMGSNGKTVSSKDFRGRYVLVYFGYTSCPDVCPTTLADLGIALDDLGKKADAIQPLFVTIDPTRDTPDVLKNYMAAFSPRLIWLTGSPQEISAVEKKFQVYVHVERTGSGESDYAIDHSSVFYLIGPDGNFVTVLPADQPGDDLAKSISPYLTVKEPQ